MSPLATPPRLARWLLARLIWAEDRDAILENMMEEFNHIHENCGCGTARRWYWKQAWRSIGTASVYHYYWRMVMIRAYLKSALRNLRRSWVFTSVNLASISLGLVCTLVIFHYMLIELSYDRFHEKSGRIHRLENRFKYGGAILPGPVLPLVAGALPEIETGVRIYHPGTWGRKVLISNGARSHFIPDLILADPTLLDVFTFQFIRGDAKSALADKNSVVLTQDMARLFFGDEDPLGKQLTYPDLGPLTVMGVICPLPRQSHFHVDMICPLALYSDLYPNEIHHWNNSAFFTYLLFREGAEAITVDEKIAEVVKAQGGDASRNQYYTQPLVKIHLHSKLQKELSVNGDSRDVILLGVIALLILLLAVMNYINQVTAMGLARAKEVGLRKVIGAQRKQLVSQFMVESLVTCMTGFLLALLLLLPVDLLVRRFTGMPIQVDLLLTPHFIGGAVILVIGLGLLAGSVPSFLFSSYSPMTIFSWRQRMGGSRSGSLRSLFIVIQFTISIALIVFSGMMHRQMGFIANRSLGFDIDQVVVFGTQRNDMAVQRTALIVQAFSNVPGVTAVSRSAFTPGDQPFYRSVYRQNEGDDSRFDVLALWSDMAFPATYHLELMAGRMFDEARATDAREGIIINETLMKDYGFGSPEAAVGQRIGYNWQEERIVIGVVKDFHFKSLHSKVEPMVLFPGASRYYNVSVRIQAPNRSEVLASLKKAWTEVLPNVPVHYTFADAQYDEQYRADRRFLGLIQTFSVVAIFISCLGLFGLATFVTIQRTKEIGIRKSLGASVSGIAVLLGIPFLRWIFLANILGWPLGAWISQQWLIHFVYRANLSFGVFLLSTVLAILIAGAAVGYHLMRAATANPIQSLRQE